MQKKKNYPKSTIYHIEVNRKKRRIPSGLERSNSCRTLEQSMIHTLS